MGNNPPNPPYGIIADLLHDGRCIPFLGAGVNLAMRKPPDAVWDEKTEAFLPSGSELARFLALKSRFPSTDEHDISDLAKVASYFVESSHRDFLCEKLHAIFNRNYIPGEIHSYLAEISAHKPLLIVTTNYDDLTESAFENAGRPYDLVIHMSQGSDSAASVLWWKHGAEEPVTLPPNAFNEIDLESTTVIYKMHGTVDRQQRGWESYVITEEDYINFLSMMMGNNVAVPVQFMVHFSTRPFLFLGYGLRDWNFRLILNNIKNFRPEQLKNKKRQGKGKPRVVQPPSKSKILDKEGDVRSWAIQYQPSAFEVALWESRNVKIYDVSIDEFVRRLREERSR